MSALSKTWRTLVALPASVLLRAWRTFASPPVREHFFLAMYLVCFLGGLWILTEPPRTIEGAWGELQTVLWGGFLLFGGVLGTATVKTRAQLVERIALTSISSFLALYAIFLIGQHFMTEGSRSASVTVLALGTLLVGLRWSDIWRYDYTPPTREER